MRWRKKSNPVFAIIIPDIVESQFWPLYRILGSEALQRLFELNIVWQHDNLEYILGNLDSNADIYFYKPLKSDFARYLKKNEWSTKTLIKNLPKKHSHSIFHFISEQLNRQYDKITLWNLESLCLSPDHFTWIFESEDTYTIKGERGNLLLMSYDLRACPDDVRQLKMNLPSLYDLNSIKDSLLLMHKHKSSLNKKRAEELASVIRVIHQNL